MKDLLLAIDQGTTGTTVLLVNKSLKVIGKVTTEILPTYPKAGWVEHDLNEIWEGTLRTIHSVLQQTKTLPTQIAGIGITNQRETICVWNKKTLVPQYNAIVWQCRRTADFCENLKKQKMEKAIRQKSGLVIDPYFSASKIHWLLENVSGLKEKAKNGEVAVGTIDTFLLNRMTAGKLHVTDVTNASRTSLMNIETLSWDDELLKIFGVPKTILPEIRSSAEIYGMTKNLQTLPDGIPIAGMLGDQHAALLGQVCISPGDTKITYGTGSFLLTNTGKKIVRSKNSLLTTLAWKIKDDLAYALEGSVFMAGATVQWLRDGLGIISSSAEIEKLAASVNDEDMGDLIFVPAMTGLGAPHWNPRARGMIAGITRGTNRAHIARAALEGIVYQNDDLLSAMAEDLGEPLHELKVDGGASQNNWLMQLQCDLANTILSRPKILETTALGAACAAGLAIGFWPSLNDLKKSWELEKKFTPTMKKEERQRRRAHWQSAIKRCVL